ncbi:uncharacterized protein LOC115757010 [Rhodamnia argentea]|uniref:Uncharacterized protein LOC115757010 n=1 Tax=Rhodamnia argentea TaxID=178133 RepID=A0ABM3H818_9MYRT|nr:uncharacterized protein LOC115757010 [Rhodamnia argentea]
MPRKGTWNLLRLVLLWARKGGALKLQLRLVPKFLKTIGQATPSSQIWYGERELSFDKTPVVHVKMHRPGSMRCHLPHIPCINPHVDLDPEFDDEDDQLCYGYDAARKSFLENGGREETHFDEEVDGRMDMEEEQEIDTRAEEFIARFYEQMKLQRQISYLQYDEMPQPRAS